MKQRSLGGVLALVALVITAIVYSVHPVRGSDHQDSPLMVNNPSYDITDVYLYPNPQNAANVVMQMDFHPLIMPSQASQFALDPGVLYQFKISHGTAAGVEDMVIQLLATSAGPSQSINVYGPFTPKTTGTTATLGALTGTITFNNTNPTAFSNGMKVFAGPRADPFFFDLFTFFNIIPDRYYKNHPEFGTATVPPATATSFNGFAVGNTTSCSTTPAVDTLTSNSFDVLSIVVEAPKTLIAPSSGSQMIHLWTTTSIPSTVSGA